MITDYRGKGEHDIDLMTNELPNGSYIVLISAGEHTQVRNFVVTK